MKNSLSLTCSVLVLMVALPCILLSESAIRAEAEIEVPDGIIHLANPSMQMDIKQRGGYFVNVQLKGCAVNPLSWKLTPEQMPKYAHKDAVFKGHILCLGRSGSPSENEIAAGVPLRGEQTGKVWTVTAMDDRDVKMECDAPLDGLKVMREVKLHDTASQFLVTEQFINTFSIGRVYNVLQHVTIGPPFLSKATLINSNAQQGFLHNFAWPNPHTYEYNFPYARLDESGARTTDLRLTSDPVNYLSTHIFNEGDVYGWVTAYDPTTGLVLGYVWKISNYLWINIWNQYKDGKPTAKGLEFGTTGMGGIYQKLLETDTRFHGKNSWEYIDAKQTIEKSFMGFIVKIEKNSENPCLTIQNEEILLNSHIKIQNPFVVQK
jgi:hypothetical protein